MTDPHCLLLGRTPQGDPVTLSRDEISRHTFVCGSTGSGKTSLLLSMAAGAISWGAGCMFVDGKGDRDALRGLVALAHRFGREDDLLVLDLSDVRAAQPSNTLNPFATASVTAMTSMITSMMDEVGSGDSMWKGRAIAMLGPVVRALAWRRDHCGEPMDVIALREHMGLRRIIGLADEGTFPDMPPEIRGALRAYLGSLPGYQPEKGHKQAQTTIDQHGFLQMQFTRLLGAMCEDFSHVFAVGAGDIDIADVIAGRRILVVLLPMGGQSTDQAAFMGNMIVCLLKDMMGGLSSGLVGRDRDAPPFLVMLDEFGQYTMPGTESVVATARSLGIALVFATQSLVPSRNDPEGTVLEHVLSNTANKILMRTDNLDPDRLRGLTPSDAHAQDRIDDLRAAMSGMAGLATVQTGKVADPVVDLAASYGAILEEHDDLVRERHETGLGHILPSLPSGGMIVSRAGRHVPATAYDMSGLYDAETGWVPTPGVPVEGRTLDVLRKGASNVLSSWDPSKVTPLPRDLVDLFPRSDARVDPHDAVRRCVASFVLAAEELEETS